METRLLVVPCRVSLLVVIDACGSGASTHVLGSYRTTSCCCPEERVRMKHLEVLRVLGKENGADLMTKALTQAEIIQHCERLCVRRRTPIFPEGCSSEDAAGGGNERR